jgi:hypothetical protein
MEEGGAVSCGVHIVLQTIDPEFFILSNSMSKGCINRPMNN